MVALRPHQALTRVNAHAGSSRYEAPVPDINGRSFTVKNGVRPCAHSMTGLGLLLLAVAACGTDRIQQKDPQCAMRDHTACRGADVVWVDACGAQELVSLQEFREAGKNLGVA
jgi:hypothetical protein